MTVTDTRHRYWTLREFRCCGHLWQVLLNRRRFPERESWFPRCPDCST